LAFYQATYRKPFFERWWTWVAKGTAWDSLKRRFSMKMSIKIYVLGFPFLNISDLIRSFVLGTYTVFSRSSIPLLREVM
jgi:hypothetical protein